MKRIHYLIPVACVTVILTCILMLVALGQWWYDHTVVGKETFQSDNFRILIAERREGTKGLYVYQWVEETGRWQRIANDPYYDPESPDFPEVRIHNGHTVRLVRAEGVWTSPSHPAYNGPVASRMASERSSEIVNIIDEVATDEHRHVWTF
jgi:hypothetical protein